MRLALNFVASQDRGFPHVGQRGLDVGVRQAAQTRAGGAVCVQSRQALLHIAAVPFEMPRRQRLDGGAVFALEVAAGGQMIGQALAPIKCPSLERGQELTLVNNSVLKCDQSHEEMAVGGDGSHETSLQASEAACFASIPRDGSLRAAVGPHRLDYLTTGRRIQPARADRAFGASGRAVTPIDRSGDGRAPARRSNVRVTEVNGWNLRSSVWSCAIQRVAFPSTWRFGPTSEAPTGAASGPMSAESALVPPHPVRC